MCRQHVIHCFITFFVVIDLIILPPNILIKKLILIDIFSELLIYCCRTQGLVYIIEKGGKYTMVKKNPNLDAEALNASITTSIKNGQYFKDGFDWYCHRFLLPIAQRSILTIICIITLIAFIPVAYSFNYLFPLSDTIPFIIWSKYSDEKYPELIKLGESLENAEEMLVRHFVKSYVIDREEHYPKKRDLNKLRIGRIKQLSSRRVYREYTNFINVKNKASPTNLYGTHSSRDLTNFHIAFPGNQPKLVHTVIRYTATVKRVNSKQPAHVTHWEADITFRFTDIDLILSKKKDLRLLVQTYRVKQVFR